MTRTPRPGSVNGKGDLRNQPKTRTTGTKRTRPSGGGAGPEVQGSTPHPTIHPTSRPPSKRARTKTTGGGAGPEVQGSALHPNPNGQTSTTGPRTNPPGSQGPTPSSLPVTQGGAGPEVQGSSLHPTDSATRGSGTQPPSPSNMMPAAAQGPTPSKDPETAPKTGQPKTFSYGSTDIRYRSVNLVLLEGAKAATSKSNHKPPLSKSKDGAARQPPKVAQPHGSQGPNASRPSAAGRGPPPHGRLKVTMIDSFIIKSSRTANVGAKSSSDESEARSAD